MLSYVWCVQKPAIAVPLSVSSTTTTTVSVALSLAVAVLHPAARWQRQWRSNSDKEVLQVNAVKFADALTN